MFEQIFINNKYLLEEKEAKELLDLANDNYQNLIQIIKVVDSQKQEIEYLRSLIKWVD